MAGKLMLLPLFLLPFAQRQLYSEENPIVSTQQGLLRGRKETLKSGKTFYSFLGIPYAKPPLANLRFEVPEPPASWKGTRDALREGSACVQYNDHSKQSEGSEDCLYLNVYTRQLAGSSSLLPVIVYVYGGRFIDGSGSRKEWNPSFLLEEEIVFVIFNYRMNIFGFLSTEDDASPGNAGMKDHVQVLRWVNQNIAAFGGDPKKVTIVGHSSGGASVHFLMLSPMTKGLFRGAISLSGLATDPWGVYKQPRRHAFYIGRELGYNGNSSQELVHFLRKCDTQDLLKVALKIPPYKSQYQLSNSYFAPCLEPKVKGKETFLFELPSTIIRQGTYHKVPFITGITSAEALLMVGGSTYDVLKDKKDRKFVSDNLPKFIQSELRFCNNEPCGIQMANEVKNFYFGNKSIDDNNTINDLVQMISDAKFREGAVHTAQNMSVRTSTPIYFYEFSYDGKLGWNKRDNVKTDFPGVGHADELGYFFDFGVPVDPTSAMVVYEMVKMWTNFARTGHPTLGLSSSEFPEWPEYKTDTAYYMKIDKTLSVKQHYREKYMKFWEQLYHNPPSK
ncbi:esterase FE4 isoform X2 [Anabrus simplex]|uniref:esterase FE4 isoform X2 n=1 Tax=Anabrus simplex TaxID=316456 RepID=UPI0035A3C76C